MNATAKTTAAKTSARPAKPAAVEKCRLVLKIGAKDTPACRKRPSRWRAVAIPRSRRRGSECVSSMPNRPWDSLTIVRMSPSLRPPTAGADDFQGPRFSML